MSFLPQKTHLGNLEISEVFEYYDKPCFFACRNKASHAFLALWIDETSDFDRWLYAPISLERLNLLTSGHVDMRSAFTQTEDGFVFDVKVFSADRTSEIQILDCLDLTDDLLPVKGELLVKPWDVSSNW